MGSTLDEPAIMYASMLLVEDRDFLNKEKHIAFAKSTWEICQKGYGWFVDVAGVQYVYAKGKPPRISEAKKMMRN